MNPFPETPLTITIPGTTTLLLIAAWILSWIVRKLIIRILRLSRHAPQNRRPSAERSRKLQVLIGSLFTFILFLIATMAALSMFIPSSTLIWIFGLFSAAFGLGARPLVSDLLAGMGFLFSDTFDIGKKVEFVIPGDNIQGVIEQVDLTTTIIRSPTGEEYTLPNGEIRIIRNFSRGKFSTVNISLFIAAQDLSQGIDALKGLGEEAFTTINDLVEPWQILSTSDQASSKVELKIVAKAVLGHGADIKLDFINLIQERLRRAGINLID